MDGHNSGLDQDQYVDNINYYPQEQVFHELKMEDGAVAKQDDVSPIAGLQLFPADPTSLGCDILGYAGGDSYDTALQKNSQEYVAEYTEPLVGELKAIRDLQLEYINADPVYIIKTAALHRRYSNYRKIRGDGNCGWRAIAYGYFELLLRSGNPGFIIGQHTRIVSLNNLLSPPSWTWEDFAAETSSVFEQIKASPMIDHPNDTSELERIFNSSASDSIITHFKLLTSAWMKTKAEFYKDYLEVEVENYLESDVEGYLETKLKDYCSNIIEPFGVELDHVGVQALIDCLINPAGLRVEISYLDRTAGTEVNVHNFENSDCLATVDNERPTLSLLYRPGHYDIIYKAGDVPASAALIQEHIAPSSPVQVSFLSQLPEQYFSLNYFLGSGSGIQPERRVEDKDMFRASLFQYPPFQPSPLPFQTSIFRNSAYNPSHYQSENFQPELYQPEVSSQREGHGNRRR